MAEGLAGSARAARAVGGRVRPPRGLVGPAPHRSYGLGLGAAALALLCALAVAPVVPRIAPLLFLAAVAVGGWYGGLGPALAAAVFGAVGLDYFFEGPRFSLSVDDPSTVADIAGFLLLAVLLGAFNARLRRARDQADAARRAAEAAVRAREELLAAVSHDLRTPLTTIKTSISVLRDRDAHVDEATRAQLLANAEAETDRLVRLVGEVLDVHRLEAGVEPLYEWSAVGEIASAALERCASLLGDRPIAFAVPDTLPLVRLDAALLDRALTCLLENVAAHTPPETAIAIAASVDAAALRLSVSDAGPGIPAEARERVFAKYTRLGRGGPGLGLGLALARAAVEAQGGRLCAEASPLGGVSFVLLLPGRPNP